MADVVEPTDLTGPEMVGRRVRLEPVTVESHPFLYSLATNPLNGFRWHQPGHIVSLEAFATNLWSGVLAQYVIVRRTDDEMLGHCAFYRPEINNGHVSYGTIVTPGAEGTGIAIEASYLALRMAFKVWNLRKIYLEVPEFNLGPILTGVDHVFHDEGRRREHLYYDGRWWDLVTLALYRADMDELAQIVDPFLGRRPQAGRPTEGGPHQPVTAGR